MSKFSKFSVNFMALLLAAAIPISLFSDLVSLLTASAENVELLKNGGFEAVAGDNIPEYWMQLSIDGGTGSVAAEYDAERNGTVVNVTSDYMYAVSTMENYGVVEVKPSTDYRLSYYVKMSGENVRNRAYIRQHSESMGDANENAYYFLQQYEQVGECGWKKVDAFFTTASNCKYVYIWLVSCYGTVYFDDVSLVELDKSDEYLNDNGGFELGSNGGMPVGYSGLSVDGGTGNVYKADNMGITGAAAKIVTDKGAYALKNADDNPMKIRPSTSYRLTYSVKIPGEGVTLKPMIRQNTASMGDTSENTYYAKYEYSMTGPCNWVQINVDFVTAPDAANLYFWLIADGGEVYIDNLSLYEYEIEKEYGVKNPDFERVGVNGLPEAWVFSSSMPGAYSVISDGKSYDGKGVKVVADSDKVAFCQLQQGENIEVKPNTNYQISYYLKTTNAELMRQYVTVRQFTESGADTPINTYLTPKIVYGNTDWEEIIFEFKTEETTAKINLWFIFTLASEAAYEGCAGATAYYDKVALKEIEPYTEKRTDTCENTYYYLGTNYDITGITDGSQTVSFEFTTAPDAGQLHFWLLAYSGTVLVDDITVEQLYHINEPIGTTTEGWEFVNNVSLSEGTGVDGGNAILLHTEGEMSNVPEAVNCAEYKYSFVNGREYNLSYKIKGFPISRENFLVYTGLISQTESDHSQLFNNALPTKDYYAEWETVECDFVANADSPMAGRLQFVFRSWAGTNADVLITDVTITDKLTGENMVRNPSLYSSSSASAWEITDTYTGNINFYADAENNGVAVMLSNGNGKYGVEDDFHITTPIGLRAGESYTFSYKVRGGSPASALYVYLPCEGAEWGTQLVAAWQQKETIDEWKEVSVQFTANSESKYLRFMLDKWSVYSYEIKDISIKDSNGKEYLLNGNFFADDAGSIIIPVPGELPVYNIDFSEVFEGHIGDTNNDGEVNIKDLIRLKKYLAEGVEDLVASDIDNSGQLESTDLAALRKILIGASVYI